MTHVKGGEDPYDVLSVWVISRKKALRLVALFRKETCNLRYPMHRRHSVLVRADMGWLWLVGSIK